MMMKIIYGAKSGAGMGAPHGARSIRRRKYRYTVEIAAIVKLTKLH
jgi:hypothetical protein